METALPNLHPAVIHFPLALVPLAVVLDVVSLARRDDDRLDRLAALTWAVGAVTALAAWLAGRDAADGLGVLSVQVQEALNAHADDAELALIAIVVVAAFRGVAAWKLAGNTAVRAGAFLLGVGAAGLLMVAADQGGALVYQHAVAVQVPEPVCPECEQVTAGDMASGTVLEADGARAWLVGAPVEDVQVAAVLDVSSFEGRVGVVHHWGEPAGAFYVDTRDGAAVLSARSGELDAATAPVGEQVVLVTSAIGTHFKGYVDGQMVTHGHTDAEGPGVPGLVLDGTGSVRVVALDVEAK